MVYVVVAVWEFDCCAYGNILLGVTNGQRKAFSMITDFDFNKELKDIFYEGTNVIWSDHRLKDFGTDQRTGHAYYSEHVYTTEESDVCGSITFTIYEVKEK